MNPLRLLSAAIVLAMAATSQAAIMPDTPTYSYWGSLNGTVFQGEPGQSSTSWPGALFTDISGSFQSGPTLSYSWELSLGGALSNGAFAGNPSNLGLTFDNDSFYASGSVPYYKGISESTWSQVWSKAQVTASTTDAYMRVEASAGFKGYVSPGDSVQVDLYALGGNSQVGEYGLQAPTTEGFHYVQTFSTPGPFSIFEFYEGPIERVTRGIGEAIEFNVQINQSSTSQGTSYVDPPEGGVSVTTANDTSGFSAVPEPSSVVTFGVALLSLATIRRLRNVS